MTTEDFRGLALSLPGVTESTHMGHPDFRIHGKIFATLHYPGEQWGMVKLSPEEQHGFAQTQPDVFVPVKGGWGRQGATNVRLDAVAANTLEEALRMAWSRVARGPKPRSPKTLRAVRV